MGSTAPDSEGMSQGTQHGASSIPGDSAAPVGCNDDLSTPDASADEYESPLARSQRMGDIDAINRWLALITPIIDRYPDAKIMPIGTR
jgi:hypothetical protein